MVPSGFFVLCSRSRPRPRRPVGSSDPPADPPCFLNGRLDHLRNCSEPEADLRRARAGGLTSPTCATCIPSALDHLKDVVPSTARPTVTGGPGVCTPLPWGVHTNRPSRRDATESGRDTGPAGPLVRRYRITVQTSPTAGRDTYRRSREKKPRSRSSSSSSIRVSIRSSRLSSWSYSSPFRVSSRKASDSDIFLFSRYSTTLSYNCCVNRNDTLGFSLMVVYDCIREPHLYNAVTNSLSQHKSRSGLFLAGATRRQLSAAMYAYPALSDKDRVRRRTP